MTIADLIKLMPPPAQPVETPNGPWTKIEAGLEVQLPNDYKEFIATYGDGRILDFFGLFSPFAKNKYCHIMYRAIITTDGFREVLSDEEPYDFWPASGGLLPLGVTDNGDDILWNTKGEPSQWTVVICSHGREYEEFPCGIVDFLIGLVSGSIKPTLFPDDLDPADGFRLRTVS